MCVVFFVLLHLLLQCQFILGWYFDYCYSRGEHCCFIVITSVLQSVIFVVFCVCMFKWCCSVDGCVCRDLCGSGDKALESIELNVGVCLLVACYRICVFPFCLLSLVFEACRLRGVTGADPEVQAGRRITREPRRRRPDRRVPLLPSLKVSSSTCNQERCGLRLLLLFPAICYTATSRPPEVPAKVHSSPLFPFFFLVGPGPRLLDLKNFSKASMLLLSSLLIFFVHNFLRNNRVLCILQQSWM